MLYVTTRNSPDIFPDSRVLRQGRGPDGGLYMPYRMQRLSWEQLCELGESSFNEVMAEILNRMFRTRLSGWDLDFGIGRNPVHIHTVGNRILIGECWHNSEGRYEHLVKGLRFLMGVDGDPVAGDWLCIAVNVAVLCGIFSELIGKGELRRGETMDVSVVSGDFSVPVSAWIAKAWGLPVGKIICCCNENSGVWDLLCLGQMKTGAVTARTATPLADVALPENLERILFAFGGREEVTRYLEVCRCGGVYVPTSVVLGKLREDFHISVVSSSRMESTVSGAYSTHGCKLSSYSALAYAGLMDYRSRTATAGKALILARIPPDTDYGT